MEKNERIEEKNAVDNKNLKKTVSRILGNKRNTCFMNSRKM